MADKMPGYAAKNPCELLEFDLRLLDLAFSDVRNPCHDRFFYLFGRHCLCYCKERDVIRVSARVFACFLYPLVERRYRFPNHEKRKIVL